MSRLLQPGKNCVDAHADWMHLKNSAVVSTMQLSSFLLFPSPQSINLVLWKRQ